MHYKFDPYLLHHHHHHHHRISVMQLTRSSLTYPEVSSKVYHYSFCQSDSSVSLHWDIYFEEFYLHVVNRSFKRISLFNYTSKTSVHTVHVSTNIK